MTPILTPLFYAEMVVIAIFATHVKRKIPSCAQKIRNTRKSVKSESFAIPASAYCFHTARESLDFIDKIKAFVLPIFVVFGKNGPTFDPTASKKRAF